VVKEEEEEGGGKEEMGIVVCWKTH
jgi:hypothetical protein